MFLFGAISFYMFKCDIHPDSWIEFNDDDIQDIFTLYESIA